MHMSDINHTPRLPEPQRQARARSLGRCLLRGLKSSALLVRTQIAALRVAGFPLGRSRTKGSRFSVSAIQAIMYAATRHGPTHDSIPPEMVHDDGSITHRTGLPAPQRRGCPGDLQTQAAAGVELPTIVDNQQAARGHFLGFLGQVVAGGRHGDGDESRSATRSSSP